MFNNGLVEKRRGKSGECVIAYSEALRGFSKFPLTHFAISTLVESFSICMDIGRIIKTAHDARSGNVDCSFENILVHVRGCGNRTIAGFKSFDTVRAACAKEEFEKIRAKDVEAFGKFMKFVLGHAIGWNLDDPLNIAPLVRPKGTIALAERVGKLCKMCTQEDTTTMEDVLDELWATYHAFEREIVDVSRVRLDRNVDASNDSMPPTTFLNRPSC